MGRRRREKEDPGSRGCWSCCAAYRLGTASLCSTSPSRLRRGHWTAQNRRELLSKNSLLSHWRHDPGEGCFLPSMSAVLDLNSPCQRAGTCHFLRKNTVSAMVPRDWQRQTAQQLAGALAVTGIKQSVGGLLMPDRNNRNQLLRWESCHLPCQLQPWTGEGGDGRARVGWEATVSSPATHWCDISLLPCFSGY